MARQQPKEPGAWQWPTEPPGEPGTPRPPEQHACVVSAARGGGGETVQRDVPAVSRYYGLCARGPQLGAEVASQVMLVCNAPTALRWRAGVRVTCASEVPQGTKFSTFICNVRLLQVLEYLGTRVQPYTNYVSMRVLAGDNCRQRAPSSEGCWANCLHTQLY